MAIAANLSASEITYLRQLAGDGKVADAWNYLAAKGDSYADDAASVVVDPNSILGQFVHAHWENTAPGQYEQKFQLVAKDHFINYLNNIENSGN